MFNVVIEKENHSDIDILIIREDINNIIQSIEEQLYNINVSYRNNVRKIKNNLKSLEGISESSLVILEDENINDKNLISYLTNVLEISLDCIVSTLYENDEYKYQLKNVNNIKDLLAINCYNTKLFGNILEECKQLFEVYSQVNEIEVSSTSFYELLDKSIENSVNNNNIAISTKSIEDNIYNSIIENLDSLISNDLIDTYNNLKTFAINEWWINIGPGNYPAAGGAAPAPAAGGGGFVLNNNVLGRLSEISKTALKWIFGTLIGTFLYFNFALSNLADSIISYFKYGKIDFDKLSKEEQTLLTSIDEAKKEADRVGGILKELNDEFASFMTKYWIGSSIVTGIFVVFALFVLAYVKKNTLVTQNSLDTIKRVLALKSQIDILRKDTINSMREFKIQFDYLDNEIKFCENNAKKTNDLVIAYECSMKYFIGSYAIVLYSALLELQKDGNSLSNFKNLSDTHNFKGFASSNTRYKLTQLNKFYDDIIRYDPTIVTIFTELFYFVKTYILENKNPDTFVKNLLIKR